MSVNFLFGGMKMNEEQRSRLAKLKLANAEYMKEIQWKNNALLQECLAALSSYRIVNNEQEITDFPLLNVTVEIF